MIIELKQFGQILTSRDNGREAYLALKSNLENIDKKIIIDFDGVTISPGWADEFLTPLFKRFNNNLYLRKTKNPSVKATLETLEEVNKIKFNKK